MERRVVRPWQFLPTAFLAALALALAHASPAVAQEGALSGRVTDQSTALGLSTVEVELLAGDQVTAGALTGGSGVYRLTGVAAGTYAVRFTLAGWSIVTVEGVVIRPGETTSLNATLTERSFNLNPITVTTSKRVEKALEAPAAIEVVTTEDIRERPTITVTDHVKEKAGVDVVTTGLQGNYTVVRGFNNIFSGATLTLTDNRIARVPSLRANIAHLQPTNNLDIDRVEIVLGPGSALYGPNAANGVIHFLTSSPIDRPGVAVSLAGGLRQQNGFSTSVDLPVSGTTTIATEGTDEGVWQVEGRAAYKVSDQFGMKLSGQYFGGTDYYFTDEEEAIQRDLAGACQAASYSPSAAVCLNFTGDLPRDGTGALTPEGQQDLQARVDNVALGRDYDLERWALDLRADWRPTEDWDVILSGGRTTAVNSVDLTGIGAGQVQDWGYWYGQARASYKDLFGQIFFNKSDNDDTYLLRAGRPLVDKSSLTVAQLQHAYDITEDHQLIYGLDYLYTNPQSEGTINGRHEDDDDVTEFGGYVQYDGHLSDRWNLVLAARLDDHSRLEDLVFSPRAAIVFKPTPERSLRFSYNRAFSTPTTLNLFLDISAQPVPLFGPFNYDARAQGTTENGFRFQTTDGVPDHMSPFNFTGAGFDPRSFRPTNSATLWAEAQTAFAAIVQGVCANPASPECQALAPALPAFLATPAPPEGVVPIVAAILNPESGDDAPPFGTPVDLSMLGEIAPLEPTIWQTFEAGYKGLLFGSNLLLGANIYFTQVDNFVSALRPFTPNLFLNGQALAGYLVSQGVPQDQAVTIAGTVGSQTTAGGVVGLPLGVVAPETAGGSTFSPILLTYQNLGDFDYWGADASATYVFDDTWQATATLSWVEKDAFDAGAEEVALNAPKWKGSLGLAYRGGDNGLSAGIRGRYIDAFPVASGVYVGDVESYTVLDLNLGWKIPGMRGVSAQLDISNVLDDEYQSFPGTPAIGRFSMLRILWATDF
ncbi:MAG: TonB-dependent receptor [Gemmatimonadota bacterium]